MRGSRAVSRFFVKNNDSVIIMVIFFLRRAGFWQYDDVCEAVAQPAQVVTVRRSRTGTQLPR